MCNCLCHSVSALLDDVAQSEDLVCASLSFSKTCLLLSELLVHCFRDPPDGGLSKDLAVDGQKGESSPFVTLAQGSFLKNLHDTLHLVFRCSCFSSDSYYHKEWLKNLCCVETVLSQGFSVFEGSDGSHDFVFFLWWCSADI